MVQGMINPLSHLFVAKYVLERMGCPSPRLSDLRRQITVMQATFPLQVPLYFWYALTAGMSTRRVAAERKAAPPMLADAIVSSWAERMLALMVVVVDE